VRVVLPSIQNLNNYSITVITNTMVVLSTARFDA